MLKKIIGLPLGENAPAGLKERCQTCLNQWQKYMSGGIRQEAPGSETKNKPDVKEESAEAKEDPKETKDTEETKEEVKEETKVEAE